MKKSTLYKLCSMFIQIVPPLVVLILYCPIIVERADRIISVSAIFLLIVVCLIFKDAMRRVMQSPPAWLLSLLVVIFCLLNKSIGDQLLWISAAALFGAILSLPFHYLYSMEVKPPTEKDLAKQLNEIKEKLKDEN